MFPPIRFLAAEEKIVTDYKFGVYDLLVLPPSFPYGGMVRFNYYFQASLSTKLIHRLNRKIPVCHS